MAHALGARVRLVTSLHPGYDREVLRGLDLIDIATAGNPRYANAYDASGARTQQLYAEGNSLDSVEWGALPAADLAIIAPAFHEFGRRPAIAATTISISLQGQLRERRDDGHIGQRADAVEAAMAIAAEGDLVFLSDEDTAEPAILARALVAAGATVVVTAGDRGATLYHGGGEASFAAIQARPVEPTGAGDCFATAFAVRFHETRSLQAAMRFALAAGSLATEAHGLAGIPGRDAIEQRERQVAA